MNRKKTPTKIIEEGLKQYGEVVYQEARANVRVSKDKFDKNGNQINEGGSLRDSISVYPKGKKITFSQLYYGMFQKPKSLGSNKWNPPEDPKSETWDNPMLTSIKENLPEAVKNISKNLVANILKLK